MLRRDFLTTAAAAAALARGRDLAALFRDERAPLIMPPTVRPVDQLLRGVVAKAEIAPGKQATVWSVTAQSRQGAPTAKTAAPRVAPTLRMRTGERASLTFENQLPQHSILHWHGLSVPEAADGAPRLAVDTGASYRYDFPIVNRAGTYWYHAHPHHHTGEQIYRGMAGLFLVGDAEEDALGLPSGAREIPLVLQERRFDANDEFAFTPVMHERMEGFFGSEMFGNGVMNPTHNVDSALYRLRVVNASGSRITRLGLSNGAAMTLIGTDGGLLRAPEKMFWLDMGTGERADLLIDFSGLAVGTRVMLKSLAYNPMGEMGMGMGRMGAGGKGQGAEVDLLEFVVTRAVSEKPWVAKPFPTITPLVRTAETKVREFRFLSQMMQHTINGKMWEMDRIDETVPFGSTEVWRFVNPSQFPHPVHMHEVQFQVLSRSGGRARLFPWESGWKDTVLVQPGETVEVITQFTQHRGRYLLHCHNVVHEDGGMMMNFEIV
ncbi:MAG TPA: multicopper oxidase domain-containing protein [Gemmatimonadales bacterium]|nr:multicopper oxidase domain-containing protein [Gemmatimonadales bacterium]